MDEGVVVEGGQVGVLSLKGWGGVRGDGLEGGRRWLKCRVEGCVQRRVQEGGEAADRGQHERPTPSDPR